MPENCDAWPIKTVAGGKSRQARIIAAPRPERQCGPRPKTLKNAEKIHKNCRVVQVHLTGRGRSVRSDATGGENAFSSLKSTGRTIEIARRRREPVRADSCMVGM